MSRFENINAIVTGGSSGIGKNVAERIADEGGKVIVWDKNIDIININDDYSDKIYEETRTNIFIPKIVRNKSKD